MIHAVLFLCLALAADASADENAYELEAQQQEAQPLTEEEAAAAQLKAEQEQAEIDALNSFVAPDAFQIVLETDILTSTGRFAEVRINITSVFAPLGAARVYQMVKDGAWDRAPFYRVDPDFVVQFGIPGVPALAEKWSPPIIDDPVEVSNQEGTFVMVHSGADTRAQQVFVNLRDNFALDEQNYAPLGQVVEGLELLRTYIYNPTEGRPGGCDQHLLTKNGIDWLRSKVPRINQINRAYIVE
eukprot:TRINITY_DN490_c0_g1_i1.p2 TRINITY_DN490_c0_g1~~TRINITY_DN490_c0_g1_i1.p2  ORF type:complete len:243 (+),score=110.42 TRINITY_DN490_c0_g1_i1:55-783(+)